VEGDTAAVGEQVYRLIVALGVKVTPDIADCLFAALYTDTGGFSYSNTRRETFLTAAELLQCGARPHRVVEALEQQHASSRIKLLGMALSTLQVSGDGRIASIEVTRAMMQAAGARGYETESFVDYPRSLKNVEVAVFFRETEAGEIKVSLRSKGRVDVSALAHQFHGGGHTAAAGATVAGPLAQAREKVLGAIQRAL
jgi:phosphoesterase RecJ-like protein